MKKKYWNWMKKMKSSKGRRKKKLGKSGQADRFGGSGGPGNVRVFSLFLFQLIASCDIWEKKGFFSF